MSIRVLSGKKLAPFLKRHMQIAFNERDMRLDSFLRLALEKANEFVPSESGAIFLDDPSSKTARHRERNELAAVACFGPRLGRLLGKNLPASSGIEGQVYVSGKAYHTQSILCVPIMIRSNTVGVLELASKKGMAPYRRKDFELLKIFAGYISAAIQNFLDGKRNADRARRDALTGLSNDRQFHATLRTESARAWRSGKELSLLFIDLDGFKNVNDQYGHLAGSRVLAEVGEVLLANVSTPRCEIARYGGDEYVVVLPGVSVRQAAEIAEKIRSAIEAQVFLAEPSPDVDALKLSGYVTASVGVASLLAHIGANDRNGLLKAADEAMYLSKRLGKNRVSVARARRYVARGRTEVTQ